MLVLGVLIVVLFITMQRTYAAEPLLSSKISRQVRVKQEQSHVMEGDFTIYSDALASDWVNWSWGSTVDFSHSTLVQSGDASMATTYDEGWAGLYLHTENTVNTQYYSTLRFWIHGGDTGGQQLGVMLADANHKLLTDYVVPVTPQAGTWSQVEVSLSMLGNPSMISGVAWQDTSAAAQPTFYLDQVELVYDATPNPTATPSTGPSLHVDASADLHPISPDIYGMNFADESLAAELGLRVRRWGGNATTRYNWQNDSSNRASDWFFENIPNDNDDTDQLPNGSASDKFIEQDRRTGTRTMLTVPMSGWTPKSRQYACGFSVSKYGPQQQTDPWRPDCGNGIALDGSEITGNDPADTSLAIDSLFVQDWINHLIGRYGRASEGGVAFYNLDNEPMLWNQSHRDVHPSATSYDELRDRTYDYGAAIKAVDPSAQTLGPAVWGWTAYFYSALDWEPGGAWWNNPQDRNAHGGTPFLEWYLQQMQQYEEQHGTRILDYLDLHYYPQGVALSPAGDAATQALRLRSTRSLWDPTYSDESWINQPLYLLPRMKEWVEQNYPATKLAITEYNWGALEHINGALTQADVLGIFGREGLSLASLWQPPDSNDPGAFAFRIYRNYDGNSSPFGDISVSALSDDQEELAIYAALRSDDGALTLMVINKSDAALNTTIELDNFNTADHAQVYRYSNANLAEIVQEAEQPVTASGFNASFPSTSITLFVLQAATPPAAAILVGSVTLQGRPTPPDSRWAVPLSVSLTNLATSTTDFFTPTTDNSGTFTITGIEAATYEIRVKHAHTLQNVQPVTLAAGSNPINFGTLPEGDANDDNQVTLVDYSILTTTFGKCEGSTSFDGRADFNEDDCIALTDFSLLATNFRQGGQNAPPSVKGAQNLPPKALRGWRFAYPTVGKLLRSTFEGRRSEVRNEH
jgi:hypothetical protein